MRLKITVKGDRRITKKELKGFGTNILNLDRKYVAPTPLRYKVKMGGGELGGESRECKIVYNTSAVIFYLDGNAVERAFLNNN